MAPPCTTPWYCFSSSRTVRWMLATPLSISPNSMPSSLAKGNEANARTARSALAGSTGSLFIPITGIGGLNNYGGPIGKHLGNAGRDFGCVVTDSDDCIGSDLGGVLNHDVERVRSGFLTHPGP